MITHLARHACVVLLAFISMAGGTIAAEVVVDATRLPVPAGRSIDFSRDVQPLFEAHCIKCHGPEKQKSGFRLDSREAALQGGEHGKDIVPGDSAESRLIHFVAGLVEDMRMPPKGDALTSEQVAILRAWIDQGAAWSDSKPGVRNPTTETHWAFRPSSRPAVPVIANSKSPVADRQSLNADGQPLNADRQAAFQNAQSAVPNPKSEVRNPIDAFILQRLQYNGSPASPEADRRTLIRRLSFDLIGLPPTPEEVTAFRSDSRPDAYERLVDRLLASPRYGERWARHWLDVVHYGESHGYDKDKPRPNAWHYRDYVIRSLNEDKPWSRFVEEQLAGDVLYPDDPLATVALGFIAAGPWDFVGHVELPESKTDGLIARYNDRDDMLMTTMSSFVSLTVHCARCHDHKFDPITQREYYGLQAVFAGIDRADRPIDRDPAIHAKRRTLTAEQKRLQTRERELSEIVSRMTSPDIAAADAELKKAKEELAALPSEKNDSPSNGYHSGIEATQDVVKWVQVDLGAVRHFDEVRLVPARPTDFPDTPGFGFPKRFRVEASDKDDFAAPLVLADHTNEDFPNPGDRPVIIAAPGTSARFIRITATRLWERTKDYVFALAELEVPERGSLEAPSLGTGASVEALDSIEAGRWGKAKLVDGYDSRHRLDSSAENDAVASKRKSLRSDIARLDQRRSKLVDAALAPELRSERIALSKQLEDVKQALDALPKPGWVYAAANDFKSNGNFHPPNGCRPVHFLRRGDVKQPREPAVPSGLACLPGLDPVLAIADSTNEGQRRAALAKWLTDARNLQLRRSIVNRVWQYHFGRGLVDSPNDFGRMGSDPSHPELLDWLAYWFTDNGESLKKLHRLIVTSATWRQQSDARTASAYGQRSSGAAIDDSDNKLLWHMNRQRLDAECVRDAILFVTGKLDLTMGGPSVQQFHFKDDHSPVYDYTQFDVDSPASFRRSIYRFIVRSVPDPLMDSMDCPDANLLTPKRNTTLTALQALALLNDPFIVRQAEHFASRLERSAPDVKSQVTLAYELALARLPRAEELAQLAAYAAKHGLSNACRVLFNTSEFSFVD